MPLQAADAMGVNDEKQRKNVVQKRGQKLLPVYCAMADRLHSTDTVSHYLLFLFDVHKHEFSRKK